MFTAYVFLVSTIATARDRYGQALHRVRDERGASAIEYVVIALGSLLAAVAIVAVVRAAIDSRNSQLN